VLDGKSLGRKIREEVTAGAREFRESYGRPPGLAVVLVGDDPASAVYVGNKEKSARAAGFRSEIRRLAADASRDAVLDAVRALGEDDGIDGLLVQLPLPAHLDAVEVQRAVDPEKDVDGFHPENAGRLLLGQTDGLVPCTPLGVMALIDSAGIDLRGAEAVVVGRSNIVGKPVALLLLARHATVTVCHSRTNDLKAVCSRADVLIAATGIPGLIRAEHVKRGAVVIDVGIHSVTETTEAERLLAGQPTRLERFARRGHALVGDVLYGEVAERAGAITPVPGGVGPLTVAMLLSNTLGAASRRVERAQGAVGAT
jgi:methylenetetrahydrofolate dehydrogenase (NADP+)/methenyltetrahydrofolate cyclohydrolase